MEAALSRFNLKKVWFFLLLLFLLPSLSFAAMQADLALAHVKNMLRNGEIENGEILTIAVKQGNINNFWGKDQALKRQWEMETGTIIDTVIIPQKPVMDFLEEAEDVDITLARQREYPDLAQNQLISDLTAMVREFGFNLGGTPPDGYVHLQKQAQFNNRFFAIPADGDIAVLYLRSDLLENPRLKQKYQAQFSRPLTPPQTWPEYRQQVAFFQESETVAYGSCEQRNPENAWMFWMPRYVSKRSPNMYLFDDQMHPLINSTEGIEATRSYLATLPYSPPGITNKGNNYSYTLPLYRQGDCYSMIITLSLTKLLNQDGSVVKGRFKIYPMPGWSDGKNVHSRTSYIYGNNLVIPSTSRKKKLAFLYAM